MAHQQYAPWNANTSGQQQPPPAPPAPPQRYPQGYNHVMVQQHQQVPGYAYNQHAYNSTHPPPPPPGYNNYNQNTVPPGYGGSTMHMTNHPQYQPYQQQQGYYPPPANPPHHQSRKRPRLGDNKNPPQIIPTPTKQQHAPVPVPPKQQWTCDTCSVTVDSEKAYQAHCASHIPCPAPGCDFQGAPKVVKGHHQSVHGKFSKGGFKTVTIAVPGCKVQRFKICVGNRPEDVQQWIAERKKRFPRKQPPLEQTARNSSGDTNDGKNAPKIAETAKVGLSSLLEGYGSSSDEEEVDKSKTNLQKDGKDKASATAKNEIQETNPTNSNNTGAGGTAASHPNYRTRLCKFFARNGSCRHGDNCRFKHEKVDPSAMGADSHNKTNGPTHQRRPKQPPKNLLRDLLVNDIARERNLTLRLLKYIVDQDFLSEESDNANDTEA